MTVDLNLAYDVERALVPAMFHLATRKPAHMREQDRLVWTTVCGAVADHGHVYQLGYSLIRYNKEYGGRANNTCSVCLEAAHQDPGE